MTTRTRSVPPTQSLLGLCPVKWGVWPSPDARLTISGKSGVWAFRQGIEYGPDQAVAVVCWQEREQPMAEWTIVPLARVYVEASK